MTKRRTILIAVYIAFCSLGVAIAQTIGGNVERAATLNAIDAASHWAWYQAKTTRRHLVSREEIPRYLREQKEISAAAKAAEAARDENGRIDKYYDLALILFSVAITMASAAIAMQSAATWIASAVAALCGTIFLIAPSISDFPKFNLQNFANPQIIQAETPPKPQASESVFETLFGINQKGNSP